MNSHAVNAIDISTIAGNDAAIGFSYGAKLSTIVEAKLLITGNGYNVTSTNIHNPNAWTLSECKGCVIVPDCWVNMMGTGLFNYQIILTIQNTPESYTITVQNGLFIRR